MIEIIRVLKAAKRKLAKLATTFVGAHIPCNSLLIEVISTCNSRCTFCPMQSQNKISSGRMSFEKFEKLIINNAEYIKNNYAGVEPYFRGEPLLHTEFWSMCKLLDKYGIKNAGINSNLSLPNIYFEGFTEFNVPLLVNMGGVTKSVHESVMRNTNFDLVVDNIRKLIENGVVFSVKINPTKLNIHEVEKLPEFMKSLGGREDQVLVYSTCYPIPARASQLEKEIYFRENISPDVEPHLRFTYDLTKPGFDIRSKNSGCNFLVDTIFFDGQLSICCHDQLQDVNIGNVFDDTLENLRASAKYTEAVKKAKLMQHPMCPECN